jgi:hypothetical protein
VSRQAGEYLNRGKSAIATKIQESGADATVTAYAKDNDYQSFEASHGNLLKA